MTFGATQAPPTPRAAAARDVEAAGKNVNKLRMDALEADMPFVAGVLRGAEESILCAYTMLNDTNVKDDEL